MTPVVSRVSFTLETPSPMRRIRHRRDAIRPSAKRTPLRETLMRAFWTLCASAVICLAPAPPASAQAGGSGVSTDPLMEQVNEALKTGNSAEVLRLIRAAVDRGHLDATYLLGNLYQMGTLVPRDDTEAARLYRAAADKGHRLSRLRLGSLYLRGIGVPRDVEKGLAMIRAEVDAGDASAARYLAQHYSRGEGVTRDDAEALRLYRLAAERGDTEAMYQLGIRYHAGQGVPQDLSEGIRLMRVAAEKGSVRAAQHLARYYDTGAGVRRDPAEAFRLLRIAANTGDAESEYLVGKRYLSGEGIAEDRGTGIGYLVRAKHNGYSPAGRELDAMLKRESRMRDCAEKALEGSFGYVRTYMSVQSRVMGRPIFLRGSSGTGARASGDYFEVNGPRPGDMDPGQLSSSPFQVTARGFSGITERVSGSGLREQSFASTRGPSEEARSIALSLEQACRARQ